ncbi:MAG: shikimate dehydrogenase family protein, partial [Candidatus Kapaibacterium sp.]
MSVLKLALLGKELSHTLSRELHLELFKILSKKTFANFETCSYDLIECAEEYDLTNWIKTAQTNNYIGANVTYPYKAKAFDLSHRHLGVSAFIDSANTLRITTDEVECLSTDGAGLIYSILRKYAAFDLGRYHLVLVGAGNAARAVVYSLCTKWMPLSLTIASRAITRAEELAEFCIAQSPGPTVRVMNLDDLTSAMPEERHRLIIQCTPVGQINYAGNLLNDFVWHETDFAIDLIYNPLQTDFLQGASHAGAKTMNGLGMLIE